MSKEEVRKEFDIELLKEIANQFRHEKCQQNRNGLWRAAIQTIDHLESKIQSLQKENDKLIRLLKKMISGEGLTVEELKALKK